ncbi:MAG: TetR/AcrR family transcriptional regulator [Pseudomonadota bacterium]
MTQTRTSRSVGRPRQFDEEAALEAAMDAFWAKGYEATSMADLCSSTGLHKGSLYQAFGDKHQLFMKALKAYSDQQFKEVAAAAFNADSPIENIKSAVHVICGRAGQVNGCMMINSMVELAPHDPEVRETLQGFAQQRFRFMADLIGKAQQAGEIRADHDPVHLARQLMLTIAGGAVMVKSLLSIDDVQDAVETLIDSWV